ncbi:hypothetical protein PM082_012319 [Marasmius tenuissimus]|nr:hypothetical protein PM082_012319 [Marasmius tenuissimus]
MSRKDFTSGHAHYRHSGSNSGATAMKVNTLINHGWGHKPISRNCGPKAKAYQFKIWEQTERISPTTVKAVARLSSGQPKAPAPKAPMSKKQAAVSINIDAEDSPAESEPETQPPPPRKRMQLDNTQAPVPPAIAEIDRCLEAEDNKEEHDEYEGSDLDNVVERERENDKLAARHLDYEAVQFTSVDTDWEDEGIPAFTSLSCPPTVNSTPALIENELNNFSQEQLVSVITSRKAKHLELELPKVAEEALPMSHSAPALPTSTMVLITNATPPSAATPVQWHERTNIVVTTKSRTFELKILGQPAVMCRIMCKAISLGKLKMATDHTFSPVGAETLKQLAHAALVKVAEDEGFDGEGDVCDHLEEGGIDRYIKPLVNYIGGHIRNQRKYLKNPSSTVLGSFSLTFADSRLCAAAMVHNRTYIYPQDGENFDYSRSMEHPVIIDYIHTAFFSLTPYGSLILQRAKFTSTESTQPDELEVPKGMVVLACATIHACLQDHAGSVNEQFPTKELDGVWNLAVDILTRLERQNRAQYHQLMHNIYVGASQGSQTSTVNQVLMGAINWTAIATSATVAPPVVTQPSTAALTGA